MPDSTFSIFHVSLQGGRIRKIISLACLLIAVQAFAQAPVELTDDDVREIRALSSHYLEALGACDAEGYADLFAPDVGYFTSRYRCQI